MAHSSIRFGIGRFTTEEEIDFVTNKIVAIVERASSFSPALSGLSTDSQYPSQASEICRRCGRWSKRESTSRRSTGTIFRALSLYLMMLEADHSRLKTGLSTNRLGANRPARATYRYSWRRRRTAVVFGWSVVQYTHLECDLTAKERAGELSDSHPPSFAGLSSRQNDCAPFRIVTASH